MKMHTIVQSSSKQTSRFLRNPMIASFVNDAVSVGNMARIEAKLVQLRKEVREEVREVVQEKILEERKLREDAIEQLRLNLKEVEKKLQQKIKEENDKLWQDRSMLWHDVNVIRQKVEVGKEKHEEEMMWMRQDVNGIRQDVQVGKEKCEQDMSRIRDLEVGQEKLEQDMRRIRDLEVGQEKHQQEMMQIIRQYIGENMKRMRQEVREELRRELREDMKEMHELFKDMDRDEVEKLLNLSNGVTLQRCIDSWSNSKYGKAFNLQWTSAVNKAYANVGIIRSCNSADIFIECKTILCHIMKAEDDKDDKAKAMQEEYLRIVRSCIEVQVGSSVHVGGSSSVLSADGLIKILKGFTSMTTSVHNKFEVYELQMISTKAKEGYFKLEEGDVWLQKFAYDLLDTY